ncbi:MAG: potassium transporter TrkG [Phycisphaerae bacterium]|nr:potassium transporter TrkG [Phycisphaerae bacterium]
MAGQTLWQEREVIRTGTRVLNVLTCAAMMAGVLAIAFEFGWYSPPLPRHFLRAVQYAAVLIFVIDVPGRFVNTRNRREFPRRRWADLSLLALLIAGLIAQCCRQPSAGADFAHSYRLVFVLYIAAQTLLRALRLNMILAHSRLDPARLMLVTFAACILLGAAALKMPRSVPIGGDRLNWTDAVFTSTSAMCVTGLAVRATGSDQTPGLPAHLVNEDLNPAGFTFLGQVIILVLIQLGGLGIMIFGTIFAVLMGQVLTIRQGLVMQDMLSSETLGQIGRVVKFVFGATFIIEVVGALLMYTMVADFGWSFGDKLFFSTFHSISAFCNAGFSLTDDSFIRYHAYWQIHGVIAPLIVLGGLGFPVLLNLTDCIGHRLRRLVRPRESAAPRPHLTLHTRLVLWTSAFLILAGMFGLMLMESTLTERRKPGTHVGSHTPTTAYAARLKELASRPDPHQLRDEPVHLQVADAWFMSVTARTAGYNTVDMDYRSQSLSHGSLFLLILLMMIGGSPASTAGGMKTVTLAVLVLTVASAVRRSEQVEGFKRSLPVEIVRRAATIAVCYVGLVFLSTMLLAITEANRNPMNPEFIQLLFEAASGCGTVGLSTNLTPYLTMSGRWVLILSMFAGRLGPLTLLIGITTARRQVRYELPQERVVLG